MRKSLNLVLSMTLLGFGSIALSESRFGEASERALEKGSFEIEKVLRERGRDNGYSKGDSALTKKLEHVLRSKAVNAEVREARERVLDRGKAIKQLAVVNAEAIRGSQALLDQHEDDLKAGVQAAVSQFGQFSLPPVMARSPREPLCQSDDYGTSFDNSKPINSFMMVAQNLQNSFQNAVMAEGQAAVEELSQDKRENLARHLGKFQAFVQKMGDLDRSKSRARARGDRYAALKSIGSQSDADQQKQIRDAQSQLAWLNREDRRLEKKFQKLSTETLKNGSEAFSAIQEQILDGSANFQTLLLTFNKNMQNLVGSVTQQMKTDAATFAGHCQEGLDREATRYKNRYANALNQVIPSPNGLPAPLFNPMWAALQVQRRFAQVNEDMDRLQCQAPTLEFPAAASQFVVATSAGLQGGGDVNNLAQAVNAMSQGLQQAMFFMAQHTQEYNDLVQACDERARVVEELRDGTKKYENQVTQAAGSIGGGFQGAGGGFGGAGVSPFFGQ